MIVPEKWQLTYGNRMSVQLTVIRVPAGAVALQRHKVPGGYGRFDP